MYNIIKNKKISLGLSSFLIAASLFMILTFGLRFGVDFTGGSLLEIKYPEGRPATEEIKNALNTININDLSIKPVGDNGLILKFKEINEVTHQKILTKLNEHSKNYSQNKPKINNKEDANATTVNSQIIELRFDSVGPSIGTELKLKSLKAIFWVIITIVLFIAWTFRKVSKPISSWKYGIISIIALFHDIIILCGAFALLGKLFAVEIGVEFIAAILTILGYSVNDTIVVFDRLRENLPKSNSSFHNTVNISINQTITRSINTSLTTLLVLLSIYILGGVTVKNFILALMIGILIGTYSSIFLASPLMVVWNEWKKK